MRLRPKGVKYGGDRQNTNAGDVRPIHALPRTVIIMPNPPTKIIPTKMH